MSNQKWPKKVRVLLACAGIAALGLTVLAIVIARKSGEPRGIVSATERLERPRLETESEMTETAQMTFEDARWQTGGSREEVGERQVVVLPPKDGRYQLGVVAQHGAFVPLEDAQRLPSSSTTEVTFEDARWRTGDWRDEVEGRQVVVFPLKDGRYQPGVVNKHGAFIPFKDAEPLASSWHGPPIYGMRLVDRIDDVSMDNILVALWRRLLDDLQQDHPDGAALIRDLEDLSDHLERITRENRHLPADEAPSP